MINRNEIEIATAQKCGISPEMSSIFFEVFVNRVSNRLKPGETLPFDNFGYFQKRNCRFKVEKSPEHPEGKSYLFNLVLFSENQIIKDNFNSVIYLRIPDLKTLWKDDREFHNSLRAGDFYPFTERNQLIKSFATKAEVIISGMMKTYDSDLEEELIIPYSDDLNFELEVREKPDLTGAQKDESGNTLPWGFGSKFMEGKEQGSKTESGEKTKQTENKELIQKNEKPVPKKEDEKDPAKQNLEIDEALKSAFEESKIKSEHIFKPDFEPVKSRISSQPRNRSEREDQSMLRQNRGDALKSSNKSENKFTEVKSKTEVYHLQEDDKKSKKKNKLFEREYKPTPPPFSPPKRYYGNRNLVAIIVILSMIIILGTVIYIYLIKDDSVKLDTEKILLSVNTPPDVNIIEREYEYAVSYPYQKLEQNIPIEGINPKVFSEPEETTEKVTKPLVEKQVVEKEPEVKKVVEPEIKTVEKPVVTPGKTEKKVNRIFLLNNYFVVQVGTYSTYASADREAEKYFNDGYNAMVEVVEVPGKPTRYVLNVGDFTSEEFARDFETKYLK